MVYIITFLRTLICFIITLFSILLPIISYYFTENGHTPEIKGMMIISLIFMSPLLFYECLTFWKMWKRKTWVLKEPC